MIRPGALALGIALAATLGAPAAGASGSDEVADLVAGAIWSGGENAPVFFGPAGEIYESADAETWRRRTLGGVAARVAGILRTGSGALYAVGPRTPLFRRERGMWHAHPLPNRGPTSLAPGGGVPALGVGRHVYVFRDGAWRRSARAPGEIAAVWAGASGRVYVATDDAKLHRLDGGRRTELQHPLERGDRITGFVGVPGEALYATAASGAVLRVGPSGAAEARKPDALAGLQIDALGHLPDGTPALAGRVSAVGDAAESGAAETDEAPARAALVALRGRRLHLLAWLPPLAPGDRIAAIAARGDAAVVATRGGAVAIRERDGWRQGRVTDALPDSGERRYERAGPARSP